MITRFALELCLRSARVAGTSPCSSVEFRKPPGTPPTRAIRRTDRCCLPRERKRQRRDHVAAPKAEQSQPADVGRKSRAAVELWVRRYAGQNRRRDTAAPWFADRAAPTVLLLRGEDRPKEKREPRRSWLGCREAFARGGIDDLLVEGCQA
jgi:hypothetical protein